MDDLQQRIAELIWQQPPELLDDLPRIKALLSDHLPHHPAYRRALVAAVECGVARAVTECNAEHLPLSRPQFLNRLRTEGFEELTSSWSIDALVLILGTGFDPELCYQMGRRLAPEALLGQLETSESEQTKLYKAFCCFRRSADKGHLEASLWLGEMLRLGKGIEKNEYEGTQWIMRAAEGENPAAQCILGRAYLHGIGVQRSIELALKWQIKSAKQGDANAQFELAQTYSWESFGVQNHSEAMLWFRQAALQGHPIAAEQLGGIYKSQGNDEKALKWLARAASSKRSRKAFREMGDILLNQPSPDFARAFKAYSDGAEHGDLTCFVELAELYERGSGVAPDIPRALDLWQALVDEPAFAEVAAFNILRIQAESGDLSAQVNLGITFENGAGVARDFEQAIHWYRAAAEAGDADGQWNFGDMYEHGKGVAANRDEAFAWYFKAAEQGHEAAQQRLAETVTHTKGFEPRTEADSQFAEMAEGAGTSMSLSDEVELHILQTKAEAGDAAAQNLLGESYRDGKATERNLRPALDWFRRSANQGWADAQANLAEMLLAQDDAGPTIVPEAQAELSSNTPGTDAIGSPTPTPIFAGTIRLRKPVRKYNPVEEALSLLTSAAAGGHSTAPVRLAEIYSEGIPGSRIYRSSAESLKWYMFAANRGNVEAIRKVTESYVNGEVDSISAADAVRWYRVAAEQGDVPSQLALANVLYSGMRRKDRETLFWYSTGKPIQNKAEAILWYCTAVENGHPDAKKTLESVIRDAVEYGRGDELREWLRVASKEGRESAKSGLKLADELIAAADDEGGLDQE